MERTFAGDIEIGFEWMVRDGMRRRVSWRDFVPIQTDPCDLHLLDIYQERIACQTVADSCVEERDDRENHQKYSGDKPRGPATCKIAEC